MAKDNNKITLLGCDNVETAREVIESDKNTARKKAFLDAYEKTKLIVPDLFIKNQRKKKNGSSNSGGKGFSQEIIVTPEKVNLETKETKTIETEHDRERED